MPPISPAVPPTPRWGLLAVLTGAQLISVLGEHLFLFTALPLWANDVCRGAPAGIAAALAAATAPALLSLHAGAWTARYPTATVLRGSGLVRLLLVGIVLLLTLAPSDSVPFVPILALVAGIVLVDSFFMPALKAAVPNWFPADQLLRANAFLDASDGPAQVLGPLLAVALYGRFGIIGPVVAQFLAYAVSFAGLLALRFPEEVRASPVGPSPLNDLVRAVLTETWANRAARATLLSWTVGMAAAGLVQVLLLPYITEVRHLPETLYGVYGALLGGGMVIGAVLLGIWDPPLSPIGFLLASVVVTLVGLTIFVTTGVTIAEGSAMLVVGIGFVCIHVGATTIFQESLPESLRAGALGLIHAIEAAGLLLGLLIGGALAERIGIRTCLYLAVFMVLMSGALLVPARRNDTK